MKIFIASCLFLLCLISGKGVYASDKPCSEEEVSSAKAATNFLINWDQIYLFFKKFHDCYDDSIAPAAEESIQKLWVNRWSETPKMVTYTKQDPKFKAFILQRIGDDTFPQDEFDPFVRNAREKCPKGADEFCRAVIKEASKNLAIKPAPR